MVAQQSGQSCSVSSAKQRERCHPKIPPEASPEISPEMATEDLTAIVIPDSKAKPPQYYNYLGKKAKAAVKETIEDLFRTNLWNEMSDLTRRDCGLNKTIAAWCEMHGIDDDYSETVRQKYYRMRTNYSRRGIFLGSLTRKRSDE